MEQSVCRLRLPERACKTASLTENRMIDPSTKPSPLDIGALEFEVTDFSEARLALEEPPEGLQAASALRGAGRWDHKRRPKLPTDRALVGRTLDWILALPEAARPKKLADSNPRIANALAECWHDPARADAYLNDLLIDRRGGRRGLPTDVKDELQMLQQLLLNTLKRRDAHRG
jgi:hypothetical protein